MIYIKEFINNYLVLIIISSIVFFLCIISLILNFDKIKKTVIFILKTHNIFVNIIKKLIIFVLNIFQFNIKKFILEYKLTFRLKNKNNRLICDLLHNLFLLFIFMLISLDVVCYPNNKFNSILLMLDGAIISIWITNFTELINSIKSYVQNLNRTFTTLSTMLQVLSSSYELFVGIFPYNDELFKKGDDIIYITPYGHGGGVVLQKESAEVFINYFQSLTPEQLIKAYNEENAKHMALFLSEQRESIRTAHSFITTSKDFIPNYIIDLFEQVYSLVDKIVNFHQMYKNLDFQLRMQSSSLYSAFIYKLSVTIMILQDEQLLYKEFINHISHPPKIIFAKTLNDAINLNKKIKQRKRKEVN